MALSQQKVLVAATQLAAAGGGLGKVNGFQAMYDQGCLYAEQAMALVSAVEDTVDTHNDERNKD